MCRLVEHTRAHVHDEFLPKILKYIVCSAVAISPTSNITPSPLLAVSDAMGDAFGFSVSPVHPATPILRECSNHY